MRISTVSKEKSINCMALWSLVLPSRREGKSGKLISLQVKPAIDVLELYIPNLVGQHLVALQQIDQAFSPGSHFAIQEINRHFAIAEDSQFLNVVAVGVGEEQSSANHLCLIVGLNSQRLSLFQQFVIPLSDKESCRGQSWISSTRPIEKSLVGNGGRSWESQGLESGRLQKSIIGKDLVYLPFPLLPHFLVDELSSCLWDVILNGWGLEVAFEEGELGSVGGVLELDEFLSEKLNAFVFLHVGLKRVGGFCQQSPLQPPLAFIHLRHLESFGAVNNEKCFPHPNYNQQ